MVSEGIDTEDENAAETIPDYEPEYESLAIDLADYQFAV
jgi:hypothetical protein